MRKTGRPGVEQVAPVPAKPWKHGDTGTGATYFLEQKESHPCLFFSLQPIHQPRPKGYGPQRFMN